MNITKVVITPKTNPKYPSFLGFVQIIVDGLVVDGIGLHKNSKGEVNLAFPRVNGKNVVYPLDFKSRKSLTDVVKSKLEDENGEVLLGESGNSEA